MHLIDRMLSRIIVRTACPGFRRLITPNLALEVAGNVGVHASLVAPIALPPFAPLGVAFGAQNDMFSWVGDIHALWGGVRCRPE